MNASEFTRFLRSKTLASGQYVQGIPRESDDLLVEKVAKALGICCSDSQTGYFYVLADIQVDTSRPISLRILSDPCQTIVGVTDTNILVKKTGGDITFTNADIPRDSSVLRVIGASPKVDVRVQGKGTVGTVNMQKSLNAADTTAITNSLSTAMNSDSTLKANIPIGSSADALRVTDTSATKVAATLHNVSLPMKTQALSSCT